MKKLTLKITSALLAAAMLVPCAATAAYASDDLSASDQSYYKGVFFYRPGEGEIIDYSDSIDYYAYSDDYFRNSGKVYNDHLSTLSMALAAASVSTRVSRSPPRATPTRAATSILTAL